jgi:hypothetical protein
MNRSLFFALATSLCLLASPVARVQAADSLELWRLSKYQGSVGEMIEVTGTGFENGNTSVYFGNQKVTPRIVSGGRLNFQIPTLTLDKTYSVQLVKGGEKTPTQDFYVEKPDAFELWRVSQYSAKPSETLDVSGKGFTQNTVVLLGNTSVATKYKSNSSLSFVVPNDITTDKTYTLKLKDGNNSSQTQDLYIQPVKVNIELWRISDYSVFPGKTITITGSGITESTKVKFDDITMSAEKKDGHTLSVKIPDSFKSSKTYAVKLVDGDKKSESQNIYIKNPKFEK